MIRGGAWGGCWGLSWSGGWGARWVWRLVARPDFAVHAFARVRAKTSGAKAMASALAARRGHLVTPGGHSIRRRR